MKEKTINQPGRKKKGGIWGKKKRGTFFCPPYLNEGVFNFFDAPGILQKKTHSGRHVFLFARTGGKTRTEILTVTPPEVSAANG